MHANIRIAGAIVAGFIVAGCATSAVNPKPKAGQSTAGANDLACPTGAGSRIPVSEGSCAVYGRTFTNDDLVRTGATTAGDALALLDPSITVHR
jgi:hypothetical protein